MIRKRLISMLSAVALVLSLFTLLPEGALKVNAADYTLYVGGVSVWINDDVPDILGNGEASYDGSTKTLTLKKDIPGGITSNQILNIVVENDVTVSNTGNALVIKNQNVTLDESQGRLTLKSTEGYGIYVYKAQLVIFKSDIVIEGKNGGIIGDNAKNLIINKSRIDSTGAIKSFPSITLFDCEILDPTGGKINRYNSGNYSMLEAIAESDGKTTANHVAIGMNYDFKVADVRVNTYNYKDILGDGAASFDPDTKTLSLKKDINGQITDCIYESEYYEPYSTFIPILKSSINDLTINVEKNITVSNIVDSTTYIGSKYLKSPILLANNAKITGNGILTLKCGKNNACITLGAADKRLTIDHAVINMEGYQGIASINPFGLGSVAGGDLTFKYSTVSISANDVALYNFSKAFEFDRCKVATPSDATVNTKVIDNTTNKEAKTVRITTVNEDYGLTIGNVDVTSANCDDILGNGEAKYDYKNKELYICKDITGTISNKEVEGLNIYVQASVTVNSGDNGFSAIVIGRDTTINTGKNTLTLKATECGILVYNKSDLTISNSFICAEAQYAITGFRANHGEKLFINRSTIKAEGSEFAIGDFTGITVTGSELITPSDGTIETIAVYNKDGTEAKSVFLCSHSNAETFSRVEPKCEEAGNIKYSHCKECGKYFDSNGTEIEPKDTVIAATGHTPGEKVVENFVAPTDTSNGSYDEVIYCKKCNQELSRNHKIIKVVAERLVGDINGDGSITADDAIIAARLAAGYGDYAARYDSDVADMNRDGKVTADDAIIIARYAAGYGNYREIYTKYI